MIQSDPPQMAMIRKIDQKSNHEYIIEDIDDKTCLVRENKVEEIKRRVKEIMDCAMGGREDEEDERDSDLD